MECLLFFKSLVPSNTRKHSNIHSTSTFSTRSVPTRVIGMITKRYSVAMLVSSCGVCEFCSKIFNSQRDTVEETAVRLWMWPWTKWLDCVPWSYHGQGLSVYFQCRFYSRWHRVRRVSTQLSFFVVPKPAEDSRSTCGCVSSDTIQRRYGIGNRWFFTKLREKNTGEGNRVEHT